jgi:Microcystin-dependent protein
MAVLKYKDPADGIYKPVSYSEAAPPVDATPVGAVMMWMTATAPSGWALCNGTLLSRTTFRNLFDVIGVSYGIGDGITTFATPNMVSRVPVGLDAGQTEFNALAKTGGAKTHTLTTAQLPSHTHPLPSVPKFTVWGHYTDAAPYDIVMSQASISATDAAGGGAAHPILQPYIVVNFIIKV